MTATFRQMRRKRQQLSDDESIKILTRGTHGVLSLADEGGYPYGVPLSYAYSGGKIYFHCATRGHKTDLLERDSRASFCVVAADDVKPEEFTTYFKSVIAFGRARIIADETEKMAALRLLSDRYCHDIPDDMEEAEIQKFFKALDMIELSIEHMTGKESIELTRARGGSPASD